ncbi:IS200/IS605 family element transposase accessory protein TnpB [Thermus oshimai]|uniref:IS200/IS605 family element transposase accessory protein TnpB n=1 Tax=Thermus oshimai TaxID=56957 RepID=UPI0002D84BF2|nr:IS200/IS605 family element transposase accessory protein TnpB [Thermus oshimai]
MGKPIMLEGLDFGRKKAELRDRSPGYARTLSSFAYRLMEGAIRARALKEGVEVIVVNPAWTSLLGRAKYQARYGLSVHESAALVIARRGLGLREELPKRPVLRTREGYLFCPWRPGRETGGKRVGRGEWTLKELKGILRLITSPPPRKRGARRPRRRSHKGTEIAPRVLPWCGPLGPVVPAFTIGAGRASAVK